MTMWWSVERGAWVDVPVFVELVPEPVAGALPVYHLDIGGPDAKDGIGAFGRLRLTLEEASELVRRLGGG